MMRDGESLVLSQRLADHLAHMLYELRQRIDDLDREPGDLEAMAILQELESRLDEARLSAERSAERDDNHSADIADADPAS